MLPSPLDQPFHEKKLPFIRTPIRVLMEYLSLGTPIMNIISVLGGFFYYSNTNPFFLSWLSILILLVLFIYLNIIVLKNHWNWRKATLRYEGSQNSKFLRKIELSSAVKAAAFLTIFWAFSALLLVGNLVEGWQVPLSSLKVLFMLVALFSPAFAGPLQLYYLERIRKLQANKTGRVYIRVQLMGSSDTNDPIY